MTAGDHGFVRMLDEDRFRGDCVGRYLAGSTWLYLCASPQLWVTALWGAPTREDVAELLRVSAIEFGLGRRYGSLLDVSRLRSLPRSVPAAFDAAVSRHWEDLRTWTRAHAIVHAGGAAAATALGAHVLSELPVPTRVFTDLEEGLKWVTPDLASELADRVLRLVEEVSSPGHVVERVRQTIRRDLPAASLDTVARALGLSTRVLQRELSRRGTSFRRELTLERVRAAQSLLRGEASLEEIAGRLGYSSVAAFDRQFRKTVGVSAIGWRSES